MRRIFICAGGTGGHVYPALSLAWELSRRAGFDVWFVGTRRGMEGRLVPEAGFVLKYIRARGWDRSWGKNFFRMASDNFCGFFQACALLLRYRPAGILCMGSYVSLLVACWARLFRIPVFVHEQNVFPGLANKMVSRWAQRVYISSEDSLDYLENRDTIYLTGNPLRPNVLGWKGRTEEARKLLGLNSQRSTVLVFGGSRGSSLINHTFMKAWEELVHLNIQVIHVTGPEEISRVKEFSRPFSGQYFVYDFLGEPGPAYAAADVAVCRAGASTTFELLWFGLPAVMIPFEKATESHQKYNALWLKKKQSAEIICEEDLTPRTLAKAVRILLQGRRGEGGELPGKAAEKIVDSIIEFFQKG